MAPASMSGNASSNFLTDISSYGYLVIALGPIVQRECACPHNRLPGSAAPAPGADTTEPPAIYRRRQLIHPR